MSQQSPTTSSFLNYGTIVFGLILCGVAFFGLARTLSPLSDVLSEPWVTRIDLSSLEAGDPLLLVHNQSAIAVLRLTEEQIEATRDQPPEELPDPFARSELMTPDALASFENRTFGTDGTFVVLNMTCYSFGYVAVQWEDQEKTWHCPGVGGFFDAVGRYISSGPRPQNLSIPPYYVSDTGELVLVDRSRWISEADLDRILYGVQD